jgi:dipeptidyl aminopeptidase/acylaminoacyl peptidase
LYNRRMPRDITEVPPIPADERIAYGKDANQFFDVWRPGGKPMGAAVVIHGGFWRAKYDLSHASHMCAAFARGGFATANLEYRRVGNPGGGWPGTFEDVVAGFKAAAKFLAAEKTIVIGHSAGGHLALRLASEALSVDGVVALAPLADLRVAYKLHLSKDAVVEFLGGIPEEIPAVYDNACPSQHASRVRRVLIHGVNDDIVPMQLSVNYVEARSREMERVSLFPAGADHFALIDPESAAWPVVMETVDEMVS